jgi:hypothetical protein
MRFRNGAFCPSAVVGPAESFKLGSRDQHLAPDAPDSNFPARRDMIERAKRDTQNLGGFEPAVKHPFIQCTPPERKFGEIISRGFAGSGSGLLRARLRASAQIVG